MSEWKRPIEALSSSGVKELHRLQAENEKLREFASEAFSMAFNFYHGAGTAEDLRELTVEYRELGIEAGE